MDQTFSPKQVARALDVSESSLKRWCDQGKIGTIRTVGGHRRITLPDVVTFVRETQRELINPELLGLPAVTRASDRVAAKSLDRFAAALADGDELACRRVVVELYLAGRRLDDICDNILAKSMNDVGDRWECGDLEVYQERLGCRICQLVIDDLRSCFETSAANAPVAIGCSPEGDPYTLATQMAELTLLDAGWAATSLGCNIPLSSLGAAISKKRPKLVWLSVSHVDDLELFVQRCNEFHSTLPANLPTRDWRQDLDAGCAKTTHVFCPLRQPYTAGHDGGETERAGTTRQWRRDSLRVQLARDEAMKFSQRRAICALFLVWASTCTLGLETTAAELDAGWRQWPRPRSHRFFDR